MKQSEAMERQRKPGGGRKQSIADALSLNPIKVRKLFITAGAYESETAEMVQEVFNS